jgi:YrbI family 3-deoxy-D-manno-octulosonate 8-phosphate phosphatase
VVSSRANKLQIEAIQGVTNKKEMLAEFIKEDQLSKNEVVFVGNDINDIDVMSLCEFTFCPSDSHELVKQKAKIILKTKGGCGVMREILENYFEINIYKLLYS